jgi:diguanylate cyclase (GGDEF)-like protein/PAS domain S-box-containing protein
VVVVLAGLVVTNLRSQAVKSGSMVDRLLEVRRTTSDADQLAWQLVAQGFPNFTFAQQIRQDETTIDNDLRQLARDGAPVQALRTQFDGFRLGLAAEQRQLSDRRQGQAYQEALVGVDSTAQIMRTTVEQLRGVYAARASSANDRLYWGTLGALGLSAILVALLAAAFVAGRRRAMSAERRALASSERRFRALLQKASDVVLVVNADRRVSYATGAVLNMFGEPPGEVVGRPLEELLPPEERVRVRQLLERAVRARGRGTPTDWSVPRADGTVGHFEAQSTNFLDDPDVRGVVVTVRDVTERHEMEAQLRHQALHDPLTGLPNRTLFEDRVAQAITRLPRTGHLVAVVYADIDDFKSVNDSLGHAAGDQLLRTIARRLDAALRASDTAARLGGDEFACLLDGLNDVEEAVSVAQRLVASLSPPADVGRRRVTIRTSIGIACCSGGTVTSPELIRNADLAMYTAKQSRGGVALFDDYMLTDIRRRLDLREDLAQAIPRGELSVVYQPLIDLSGSSIVGIEALLRWRHDGYGAIPPEQFIPLAETSGVIVELGRWVIDRALADLSGWSARNPGLHMNVNVAPRELLEPDYVDAVAGALARHAIAPERLTLELTESELGDEVESSGRLEALAALGVNLAIDDFGSGQSSLGRLRQLPVNQIKVDQSFLSTIDESAQQATLVSSMIELGNSLGLQMVAEGIERESQLRLLQDLPCQLGQGFLLARPQTADAITSLLQTGLSGEPGRLTRAGPE